MPYPVPYAPRDFLGKNGQAGAGRTAGEAENDDTVSWNFAALALLRR